MTRLLWLLAAICLATPLHAADPLPKKEAEEDVGDIARHLRVQQMHLEYRVEADGSYVETSSTVRQLISSQAVHAAGQIRVPYSASLDEFAVLQAATVKPDGRTIKVPAASIFTQDGLISPEGVTSYQDIKTTVVVFPELEAGDSISLKTRVTRRKPMLAGQFTMEQVFPGDLLYDDVSITLDAPAGYALKIEAVGMLAAPEKTANGRTIRRWTYKGSILEPTDEASVDPRMFRPRLNVSSIASYEALAQAAAQRFEGKATVTPAIRSMAAQIVGNARTVPEQARKIHEWVAHNIRYFAIVLDVGGYVPRPAEVVLASRFGDCKDHTVLTQALLAARGIPSNAALLTTEPLYELPAVPTLSSFNHVIVYVPQIDTYLETTAPTNPYGRLTHEELDKPVLMLGAAQPVQRTPNSLAQGDRLELSSRIVIAANGNASGTDTMRAYGPSSGTYAGWADSFAGVDPVKVARQMLLARNLAGEGTLSSGPSTDNASFDFTLLYELPAFADFEGPSGMRVVPPLDTFEAPAIDAASQTSLPTQPYSCRGRTESVSISLVFPPGTQITVPKDVEATAPMRTYTAQYRVKGNEVQIDRKYVSIVKRSYCPAENVPAVRALEAQILRDLRSQIRYTPPPA